MNRKSLFSRLTSTTIANRTAQRPDYFRVNIEPLEDRKLLTATTYVDDNWLDTTTTDGTLYVLDTVVANNGTGVTKTYGADAFGKVANTTATDVGAVGLDTIYSAIQNTNSGGTLNLLAGTFKESDIVIDRSLSFIGAGQSGGGQSLIVPEVVSDHTQSLNFGTGSHSGIIVYSPSVTLSNFHLDGNGNGNVAGTLNYHQGVTTMYDNQGDVTNDMLSGSAYSSLRNGPLAPIILGPIANGHRSIASIWYNNITVDNTFFHGMTLSATIDYSLGESANSGINIYMCTVNNVGPTTKTLDNIGILIQNLDNASDVVIPGTSPPTLDNSNVVGCTVSNVGVGVKSDAWGVTPVWANSGFARNKTGVAINTVTDATLRGYDLEFVDASRLTAGDVANFTNPANTAIGMYINYSQVSVNGFISNGAYIGIEVQNSPEFLIDTEGTPTPKDSAFLLYGINITGPGTGVAGSVGMLLENSVAQPNSVNALIATDTYVSGYATGVKVDQVVAPGDSVKNKVVMVQPAVKNNGLDFDFGQGSDISGELQSDPPSVNVSGDGRFETAYTKQYGPNYYYNSPGNSGSTAIITPPTAAVSNIGNLTLGGSSTFGALITGQSGSTPAMFDFNHAASYVFGVPYNANDPASATFNHPGETDRPYVGITVPVLTSITQSGAGSLVVDGVLTNGTGLDYFLGTNNHPDPNNGSLYIFDTTDLSARTTIDIVLKARTGNQSKVFALALGDIRGNFNAYVLDMSTLPTTYTTVSVNLLSPSIDLTGPDSHLDLTKICAYGFGGDQGTLNGYMNLPFKMEVDNIGASSIASSKVNVTGTVNLGGTALSLSEPTFVPTVGQQFTLINNDGVDPVVGTFAGLAEGATLPVPSSGSLLYQISYVGGSGNDVVLTTISGNTAPVVNLNGGGAGIDNTASWVNITGAVNIAPAGAVTDSPSGNLISMTIAVASPNAGDALTVGTPGGLTVTGSGTAALTLTGTANVATYQTALESIQYNNTNPTGPGVDSVAINVVGTDDGSPGLNSTTAVATISIGVRPIIDLNGAAGGTGFTSNWNGIAVNITDPTASAADDANTAMTTITATLTSVNGGDVLSATPSGAITAPQIVYSAGVLTITSPGSPTADFQAVLRSIKYNNTSFGPGVASKTVNIVGSDGVGNGNTAVATINIATQVAARKLFYKGSARYDVTGTAWAPLPYNHDNAIATDKIAYLPGSGAATYSSISSFDRGINGIDVDLKGAHGVLTTSDFSFKVGNTNTPGTWVAAPAPTSLLVRAGSGVSGSDRVELIWADNAIQKQWLQVIVKGNDVTGGSDTNTGLTASDTFYFGNAKGDSSVDDATTFVTNANDEIAARSNPKSLLNNIPITNLYDYNRDGKVDASDQLVSRSNGNSNLNAPKKISV